MATNAQNLLSNTEIPSSNSSICTTEYFRLIWLDARSADNSDESTTTIRNIKRIIGVINTFDDVESCIEFIMRIQNEKIFLIVSGSLGLIIVPIIHDNVQLTTIYVYCGDITRHENWVKEWPKIKGIFINILSICQALEQAVRQCDQDSVPLSFVPIRNDSATSHSDQPDQSFTYTHLLKKSLLNTHFTGNSIQELVACCRTQFADNENELNVIEQFKNYKKSKAILWYTRQCFLYPMLSRSLRMMDVGTSIKMGFFIRDLHVQIEELHRKQYRGKKVEPFLVYRGQGLLKSDFNAMRKMRGGFISFNSFLSTSKKTTVAELYAKRAIRVFGLMGIIFKMTIDPSVSSVPFALVNELSYYKSAEEEILFSMHPIFRIGQIQQIELNNDQLWEVELTLTSENDPQLNALTEFNRNETNEGPTWYSLGNLLLNFGRFDKGEEVYKLLLDQTPSDTEKCYIYQQLGYIKHSLGDFSLAIKFYERSVKVDSRHLASFLPSIARTYYNLGDLYDMLGAYNKARSCYEKAIEIYRSLPDMNPLDLANALNHNGSVCVQLNDYTDAISNYRKALKIYDERLPPTHRSVAICYHSLGQAYNKTDDYSTALYFYEKALEIYKTILPSNHIDLAVCYQNMGRALVKLEEHSRALSFYEKACVVFKEHLPANQSDLIILYNNMGETYGFLKQYKTALSFYEKALELGRENANLSDSLLGSIFNRLANIYYHMKDNNNALLFAEQGIKFCRHTPPSNSDDRELCQNTLELVKKLVN